MSRIRYTPEAHEFLAEFIPGHRNQEVIAEVEKRFGIKMSDTQLKNYKTYRGIKSGTSSACMGPRYKTKLYPEEVVTYITEHAKGTSYADMAEQVNRLFGKQYTVLQIRAFYKNRKICSGIKRQFQRGVPSWSKGKKIGTRGRSGETQFKRGMEPHNKVPAGSLSHTTGDRYVVVKVAEPNKWRFLHQLIWEEANGPIPDGMMLIFLDGDRENVTLENLRLVSKSVNAGLNIRGLRSDIPEITEACISLVELQQAMSKRKKAAKDGPKK